MATSIGIGVPDQRVVDRAKLLDAIKDSSVKTAFAKASADLRITSAEVQDLFDSAAKDNQRNVTGDSTTPVEKADLAAIRGEGASLLTTVGARTFDSKLKTLRDRTEVALSDSDESLRSSQVAVDKIAIRGNAAGSSTVGVTVGEKTFQVRPEAGEAASSIINRLAEELKAGGYETQVHEKNGASILSVGKSSGTLAIGSWGVFGGKVDNRRLFGPGGEGPPSGSYLILDQAISVGGKSMNDLFLVGKQLDQDARVSLSGRLDNQPFGGVEIRGGSVTALSGISNLTAGEPKFDGKGKFTNAEGDELLALHYNRPLIMDAPAQIFVLDGRRQQAWQGSMGGFIPPQMNPFHGFQGSAKIDVPTDADRAKVRTGPSGEPVSVATGEPLVLIGSTSDPVNASDRMTSSYYMDADPAGKAIYRLESGGIAGFVNFMAGVIRLGTEG